MSKRTKMYALKSIVVMIITTIDDIQFCNCINNSACAFNVNDRLKLKYEVYLQKCVARN